MESGIVRRTRKGVTYQGKPASSISVNSAKAKLISI